MLLPKKIAKQLFKRSPLIHCVTNEITCESVANALLYVNSKPIMADDPREFDELFKQTDGLLLNLGHISPEREEQLLSASRFAKQFNTPTVIDVVGISVSTIRKQLTVKLLENQPQVVKGNTSEMRHFCGLVSQGRGVDGHEDDQSDEALKELADYLKKWVKKHPNVAFLATGETDLLVTKDTIVYLKNGVSELDNMTGTGDMVGALIASLLAQDMSVLHSVIGATSYFNVAGEQALNQLKAPVGMSDFRHGLMNQLSLLSENTEWWREIRGEIID